MATEIGYCKQRIYCIIRCHLLGDVEFMTTTKVKYIYHYPPPVLKKRQKTLITLQESDEVFLGQAIAKLAHIALEIKKEMETRKK